MDRRSVSISRYTVPIVHSASAIPRWRSLLFVPAHVSRFVDAAHHRGADGAVLDLEDSVPQDLKEEGRRQLPGSVISDTQKLRDVAIQARRLGFVGALAIHPTQLAILNEAFSPSAEEFEWARRVLAAERDAAAEGRGAFAVDGKMVDAPVVRKAREIIAMGPEAEPGI
ncbi:aldolase/citrate lyase family protein [Mesorhizobium sp.]|uniref:aldolase/citrate lyase family protein n=1 Tax=Mesorhizobium sp. TaxID=1871066 RepID=UPI001205F3EB|nr:aldolase/citrate lyase family protein [Mesorhizobium sp.]TIL30510.1 MAG: hypothetical protein E5Y82_31825 [Mesorhizobium sp.]